MKHNELLYNNILRVIWGLTLQLDMGEWLMLVESSSDSLPTTISHVRRYFRSAPAEARSVRGFEGKLNRRAAGPSPFEAK